MTGKKIESCLFGRRPAESGDYRNFRLRILCVKSVRNKIDILVRNRVRIVSVCMLDIFSD
jgi:hypothetical protein